jgi:hypothetical protein
MSRPIVQFRSYETYYFANAVRNILADQFTYIRYLDDFYGDYRFLNLISPFRRHSAFHCFLEFVVGSMLTNDTEELDLQKRKETLTQYAKLPAALDDLKPQILPIEHALIFHSIQFTSFAAWLEERDISFQKADSDHIYEYLNDLALEGTLDSLCSQMVKELFYILFGNRGVLMLFNEMIASQVSDTVLSVVPSEYSSNFAKDGILKRQRIPKWVRRAVFFRDRGICVVCRRDLSGLVNIWSQDHFDHIVPLNLGGLNDVTNIQLLCAPCNLKKRGAHITTSDSYEDWYA